MFKAILNKSTQVKSDKPFPKIMRAVANGNIAFWLNSNTRIRLTSNEPGESVGAISHHNFDPTAWEDYNDPVTIQNI